MIMPTNHRPVFRCQLCGECCEGRGGILPTAIEIEIIARFLKMSVRQFKETYLESTPLGLTVKNKTAGGCIFNDQGRCQIHPVKPRICRNWPFLPAILLHENEFEAAKSVCPGFDPDCRYEDFLWWWRKHII
ncbi:MAG TPA: YkgJ family cysteine cluster protein [Desulfobacterales bacterium]|nr:YkgJ family cysteine cluster protein [Desulfobacterales bacterium]